MEESRGRRISRQNDGSLIFGGIGAKESLWTFFSALFYLRFAKFFLEMVSNFTSKARKVFNPPAIRISCTSGSNRAGTLMVRLYRSRDEILVDLLRVISEGVKKTHIMQRANLNPLMFKKYFPVLLENGLVAQKVGPDGDSTYALSDEGREFLRMLVILLKKLSKEPKAEPACLLR